MRSQNTAFLGLFLLAFGLYASQWKKHPVEATKPASAIAAGTVSDPAALTRIQVLYDGIAGEKVFAARVSGVKLTPARVSLENDFTVTFSGDEVYADQGFAIQDNWESTLDSLAERIARSPGLHVEISGYADEGNPKERQPGDYGSSALAFSFARAEWLAHYFERKHGINIAMILSLRGMGAVPHGKKIELRFFY